jgi:N-acetyl-anhydromuramyl-L-alanine amidase AmpD
MDRAIIENPHGGDRVNVPKTIIIHCMGEYIADGQGGYDHAVEFLDKYKLSVHSLIASDGTNFRCRQDDQHAWHARGHNRDSLGMEFLVPGDHDYRTFIETIKNHYTTTEQYQAGVAQVREWIARYDIERITRHSDISPGRKVDPGRGFPWRKFLVDIGWDYDKT